MESVPNEKNKPRKKMVEGWVVVCVAFLFLISGLILGNAIGRNVGYQQGVMTGFTAHALQVAPTFKEYQSCWDCSGVMYEKEAGFKTYENGTREPVYALTCDCGKV